MKNSRNDYLVVGDAFEAISKKVHNVLTETDVLERLLSQNAFDQETHLHLQQGVDAGALSQAVKTFNDHTSEKCNNIYIYIEEKTPRALRRQAHKHKSENITISYPKRISPEKFKMDLHFSNQNELFQDHLTGLHIQGMAITESGRQAFLAVTEEFFLRDRNKEHYFVIKHMNTNFVNFLFPFGAVLEYEITRQSSKPGRESFDANITVRQGETICAEMDVSFTAFEAAAINAKEATMAQQRTAEMLNDCTARSSSLSGSTPFNIPTPVLEQGAA